MYYVPHEDARAKVSELNGKKVHLRRSPDMDSVADAMKAVGLEKFLKLTDGRGCFCFLRKLNKVWFFIYKNGFFSFCTRIKSVPIWIFRIILHVLSPQIYYISILPVVSIGSLFILTLI